MHTQGLGDSTRQIEPEVVNISKFWQRDMATKAINIPIKVHKGYKRSDLARDFGKRGFNKGAEIGVRWGKYSKTLCQKNPKLHLLSIDPFDVVYEDIRSYRIGKKNQEAIYQKAKRYLKGYNAEIVRKTSIEASLDVPNESLDFVYIDGSHQFDYVMTDIIIWGWKVKKGGIISGHDYYKFIFGDIVRAVDNYALIHKVKKINVTEEHTPTWWFERKW